MASTPSFSSGHSAAADPSVRIDSQPSYSPDGMDTSVITASGAPIVTPSSAIDDDATSVD